MNTSHTNYRDFNKQKRKAPSDGDIPVRVKKSSESEDVDVDDSENYLKIPKLSLDSYFGNSFSSGFYSSNSTSSISSLSSLNERMYMNLNFNINTSKSVKSSSQNPKSIPSTVQTTVQKKETSAANKTSIDNSNQFQNLVNQFDKEFVQNLDSEQKSTLLKKLLEKMTNTDDTNLKNNQTNSSSPNAQKSLEKRLQDHERENLDELHTSLCKQEPKISQDQGRKDSNFNHSCITRNEIDYSHYQKPVTPFKSEKVDVHICMFSIKDERYEKPSGNQKYPKSSKFRTCGFKSRAGSIISGFDYRSDEFLKHQLTHLTEASSASNTSGSEEYSTKHVLNPFSSEEFKNLPFKSSKLTLHVCLVVEQNGQYCNYETDRSDNFKKHQVGKHYPKHLSKPITCPFLVKNSIEDIWKPCDYFAVRSDDCTKHIKPAHLEQKFNAENSTFQTSRRMTEKEYIYYLKQNEGFALDVAEKIKAKWTAEYNSKTRTKEEREKNRKWIELIDMGARPNLPDLRKVNNKDGEKETKIKVLGGFEVDLRWFQGELEGWLRQWRPPRKTYHK